jgi:4-hydroxy-tetrahydrodipicolinate synthase
MTAHAPFLGLSAFPVTPFDEEGRVDLAGVERIVGRLADADVDSICVLGSTGSSAYLTRAERAEVIRVSRAAAGGTPLLAGVGALATRQVLELVEDAEGHGADGLLLAPLSYQALTAREIVGLFTDVDARAARPVCLCDNPGTTHVAFDLALYAEIAQLPSVRSIKIPPVAEDRAITRIAEIRSRIPAAVSIGVSGDWFAAAGLNAGADAWYSVLAGTLPEAAAPIAAAARAGDAEESSRLSARLEPLWLLFRRHGSLRVIAAIAEERGLAPSGALPRPVLPLDGHGIGEVRAAMEIIGL